MLVTEEGQTAQSLFAEIAHLRQSLKSLQQEKADLEILLQTTAEHADALASMLHDQVTSVLEEKADLEILLENTTAHSDAIQTQAEATIYDIEQRLIQFLAAMPVGVFVVDAESKPYYANLKAQELLGSNPMEGHDALLRRHSGVYSNIGQARIKALTVTDKVAQLFELYPIYIVGEEQRYPIAQHPILRALQGEKVSVDDMEIRHSNKVIPLEMSAIPIFDNTQQVTYAIAVLQDITQRKQAEQERMRYIQEVEEKNAALRMNNKLQRMNEQLQQAHKELERLATTDGLTQVANRRRLNEYLEQIWHLLAREQRPLSLIMCDIDFFKLYNDSYGHQQGDACLQYVAKALQDSIKRASDLVARYGGEEFAVVLPYTEVAGAEHVADSMKTAVHALQIPHKSSKVSDYVTLSVGVATTQPSIDLSLDQFVSATDKALYKAKKQGRNRISSCLFPQPA